MKTLDEVIEGYERCHGAYGTDESCEYCPLFDICEHDPQMASPWDDDMYHYLKEFQGLSKMWNDKIDKEQENPPLDWETLKQMEGKPVWIEIFYPVMEDEIGATEDEGEWKGYWALRSCRKNKFLVVENPREPLYETDYGKTWKAYRKERE